ncbi:barstar family protein [Deinococcus sp.]|uniref:barstar family protein n=1 Tax=Deinococcus sp. TaxID=47478 RepID=UPI003CC51E9C
MTQLPSRSLAADPDGFQTAPADLALLNELALYTLDLTDIDSKAELMARLAQTFKFPDSFGHNWDALYDALQDALGGPSALHLLGWGEFQTRCPELAGPLRGVLLDAQEALRDAEVSLWLLV